MSVAFGVSQLVAINDQPLTFNNTGTISIQEGSLILNGGESPDSTPLLVFDNTGGTINTSAFSSVTVGGQSSPDFVGGSITGDGEVRLETDSTLRLSGGVTLDVPQLRVLQGTLQIAGVVNNNTQIKIPDGNLQVDGGGLLAGLGTVLFEPGTGLRRVTATTEGDLLQLAAGQQVIVDNNLTQWGADVAGSPSTGAGALVVQNGGTLRVEAPSPLTMNDVSLDVQSGNLEIAQSVSGTTNVTLAADSMAQVGAGIAYGVGDLSIDATSSLSLDTALLSASAIDLDGSITGIGVVATPNLASQSVDVSGQVLGTDAADPIRIEGFVTGPGLLDVVEIAGTHSPGDGIAFTNAGTLQYTPTSSLLLELRDSAADGTGFDRVVAGDVTLDGVLNLQLVDYVDNAISISEQLTLLTSTDLSGQFLNVEPGANHLRLRHGVCTH